MENEKRPSETMQHTRRPMRGPGRGPGRITEKPKNLIGTWKKLLGYCHKYKVVMIVAIVCALGGTILTLAGPGRLSDMTDTITEGIAPDTDKLQEITTVISDQVSVNMETVMGAIGTNMSDASSLSASAAQILASDTISDADKAAFQQAMLRMQRDGDASALMQLPDTVLEMLYPSVAVNGSTISAADQMQALEIFNDLDPEDETVVLEAMADLPESVKQALYTDVVIDGSVISGKDQLEMMEIFSDMDTEDTQAALEAMDALPQSIYDRIRPSMDMQKITSIGLLLVAFYGISLVLSAVQGWIMSTVTQRVSRQMRSDISKKINRLPMWYYNRTTTGDVLSRVTNDVDTIGQSLNQSIGTMISATVLFAGSFIMMLKTDGWMTLTAVLSSLFGFVLMFAIMGRSQKYFRRQQRHLGQLNGHIEEIYTGHTVVKAYNGEQKAQEDFDRMNEDLISSNFFAQSLSGLMMPIMTFIGNFGYVAVCVVGGAMALNGRISFGVIVAFMLYVRYFTQPLSQIAQGVQSLQSAAAAGERVFEFLEAAEMEDETGKRTEIKDPQGRVEFEHVKFGYEGTDHTVIHDFTALAKPGQKIAIVGPTGAGKTTLVNLLMRFHEIQGGTITIDGISTKDLTRSAVHSQFCMVLQDTWLFEGTVRENLVYCTENVSEKRMEDACKAVGLDHFIRTLPHGYDTILNDQVNLSQGQKQQLTIARAMIADKPMLILDEATSSVDTRTEQQIQAAMDTLMENRTSFVIAHRLSTIRNSDLILVLKDGDVIESGTHEELLARNGFYAELYNSQFEQTD